MATYHIIKMKFLTPIHLGKGKDTYDVSSSDLHSDTLIAALAAMKAQKGQTDHLDEFMSSFALSSAFPYSGQFYFLPKPIGKLNIRVRNKEEHEYRKKLKNIRFAEHSIFTSLVKGECKEIDETAIQGAFIVDVKEKWEQPYKNIVNQRVSVLRDGGDATPFFFDWRYFYQDAGLYCITDATGELFNEIKSLFKQLGEEGLGTDKNVGGGKFDVEVDEIELPTVHDANATMLLSLYLPLKEEMGGLQLEQSKFSLVLRGGYMAGSDTETFRHLWKKSVYMFDVGSVFPVTQSLKGKIVDLSPDWNDEHMHPVYRSGKPFCLPVKKSRL